MKQSSQEIRRSLVALRDRMSAEIRDYPTPIPRCDAQFNHLLAQRSRVIEELERLSQPGYHVDYEALLAEIAAIGEPSPH